MELGIKRTRSRDFRIFAAVVVVSMVGTVTATIVNSARNGQAFAATLADFVPIEDVDPNVKEPRRLAQASTGTFAVNCGTNGNKKFSPDNPVAQPGIKNGAEHVHDFVGNLSTNADSSTESLQAAGTTCQNGDKSAYFWPVVRINDAEQAKAAASLKAAGPAAAGKPTVSCPTVKDKLPGVPQRAMAEVNRNLALLDSQLADAKRRLADSQGAGPDFVNNAIMGPLRAKRAATLDRIANAMGRNGPRPASLVSMADCELSFEGGAHGASTKAKKDQPATSATPTVNCPSVRDKLPGIPDQALNEVNANLALLDKQIAEANERLVTSRGQGGDNFINNAIVGPLQAKRTATIDRMAIAIGRNAAKPTGLDRLAACTLANAPAKDDDAKDNNNQNNNNQNNNPADQNQGGNGGQPEEEKELAAPSGPDFELPGNEGGIVRPRQVKIEYRGNATSKVVPMPVGLRALTGDAKPTSRGPANARGSWTCSGFDDRLSTKYPICPNGSQVQRVHDFPGCWDGENTDSANHRTHVAFADAQTGACPDGFEAIPQLRITISYNIPREVQEQGRFLLDSFPEENHNPFSDHNDFINVNSENQMAEIAECVNEGRRCN